jgi:dCMP deaminase
MGYNGSVRGQPHCDDVGHDMLEGSCVRTLHAETNAIAQAAANGTRISGAWAYVTHYPCRACAKLLVNAGIEHVLYENDYRVDARASKTFYLAGINPEKLHLPPAPSELANELLELRARIARLDPGKAPTEVK